MPQRSFSPRPTFGSDWVHVIECAGEVLAHGERSVLGRTWSDETRQDARSVPSRCRQADRFPAYQAGGPNVSKATPSGGHGMRSSDSRFATMVVVGAVAGPSRKES
jgi:hypothetical protein